MNSALVTQMAIMTCTKSLDGGNGAAWSINASMSGLVTTTTVTRALVAPLNLVIPVDAAVRPEGFVVFVDGVAAVSPGSSFVVLASVQPSLGSPLLNAEQRCCTKGSGQGQETRSTTPPPRWP